MNRPCFQYTRFVNLDNSGNEFDESWGYRLYDDYDQTYNNTFKSFEELRDVVHKENLLEYLWNNHFEFIVDLMDRGIYFNEEWMTPEELQATRGAEDVPSH